MQNLFIIYSSYALSASSGIASAFRVHPLVVLLYEAVGITVATKQGIAAGAAPVPAVLRAVEPVDYPADILPTGITARAGLLGRVVARNY
jgi:hypothetical protein